jgi:dTDP-4-dehydrorhamnose reductase
VEPPGRGLLNGGPVRILVTGAEGQVGSELSALLAGHDVVALGRHDLDLTAPTLVDDVVDLTPDVVVNCAAVNDVDGVEADDRPARAVNADAPGRLGEACGRLGAHLIHLSTDYVFAGDKAGPYDEDDTPAPLSAYGRSKLAGEAAVMAGPGTWTVVRTAIVFGRRGRGLVETILDRARAGQPLRMAGDLRISPTYALDLAGVLVHMAADRVTGLYHVANAGSCTPYELALEVVDAAGLDDAAVERVGIADLARPAPRPPNSALVSARLPTTGIAPLRHYRDAVRELVPELAARTAQGS